ncbi:MAG: N-methyl-L-tryptophan oxidase [Phycisphaerales bacterium]
MAPFATLDRVVRRSERQFDCIVVGVGTVGAATVASLARRGRRVLGIDAASVPNARSSHHGHSRVFRACYFEHPSYMPLLLEAIESWRALESAAGADLLDLCGGLYLGRPDGDLVHGSTRAAESHGLAFERWSAHEVRSRFPQFTIPDDFEGFWEPTAGMVYAERAIEAAARVARENGAMIRERERVEHWTVDASDGVQVRTSNSTYRAEQIVLCPGAWAGRLLGDRHARLTVTRQTVVWVDPINLTAFQRGRFPVWGLERPDTSEIHYGVPMTADQPGLKLALHAPGVAADPNTMERELRSDDEAHWERAISDYLPSAAGPLVDSTVCMYTNTPDSHFILGPHPDHADGRVYLGAGLSGHGFKFMPVLGEALADLVIHGHSRLPIEFLSLKRFGAP